MADKIIKEGTILTIDAYFTEKIDDAVDKGIITIREHEEFGCSAYEKWLPRDIKFEEFRLNRKNTTLAWHFIDKDLGDTPNLNLTIFRKLGYKIIQPVQIELDLMKCPEGYLNEKELILKYLTIKFPGYLPTWYSGILGMVEVAMKECGMVFYRP